MTDIDEWLARYDREHRGLPPAFYVSALGIVFGTVGLLWALPVPEEFYRISPFLNWGSTFLMATAVYYFIISLSLAIGLLPFVVGLAAFQFWMTTSGHSTLQLSISLLGLGIAGLWLSHRRRGGTTAVVAVIKDLQHMMIAPAWMLSRIYRWIGIPV